MSKSPHFACPHEVVDVVSNGVVRPIEVFFQGLWTHLHFTRQGHDVVAESFSNQLPPRRLSTMRSIAFA